MSSIEYGCLVDIWSAGVTMYKMLTGKELFTCTEDELDTLFISKSQTEEYIRNKLQKIDTEERFLIEMILEYDVNKRLTATQILQHLNS
jgi:serine/threonine protein kinase